MGRTCAYAFRTFLLLGGPPIKLGHKAGNGLLQKPSVAGLAVTAGGHRLVAAICGDSMTMPDLPRVPAAEAIRLDEEGRIEGLF